MYNSTKEALICVDFINEFVSNDGKLAQKGYADFVARRETLRCLAELQNSFRQQGNQVIFVNLGFEPKYQDLPSASPLLAGAKSAGILKVGTNSCSVPKQVAPRADDIVLVKKRISAFHGTNLNVLLRSMGIENATIVGVSTDLAVESAARDAHDLDYRVSIDSGSCAAANDADHEQALKTMRKFAHII